MRTFGRVGTDRPSLIAAVLISVLAIGSAYAEEGSSGAHGDGKGSAAPAAGGSSAAAKGSGGDGAKESGKGDAHSAPAGDGKGPRGSNESSGPARDTAPSTQTGKDNATVEPRVEPSRRLDKNRPGENPLPRVPGAQGLTRRLSPLPPAPNPVHNSIGVVVPAPVRVEPHEGPHAPTVVSHPPTVALPGPGNTGVGIPKPGLANRPALNPTVTPSLPNRGAITGTGLTRRNVAPPRIGGPVNSVAGINGTAIRSKH
jgi:hypothetical protein